MVRAGQLVVAVAVRQSLSRLWVPHSSCHSAWQARSPRRMNRRPLRADECLERVLESVGVRQRPEIERHGGHGNSVESKAFGKGHMRRTLDAYGREHPHGFAERA